MVAVFKDENVLKSDFLPESLPGRESQLNELVDALKPAFDGRRARNVFAFGPPGTGKTSSVKLVFSRLQEESQRAKTIFVNCWQNPTRNSVLTRIAEAVGEPLPRRGLGTDEVQARVAESFAMQKIAGVIALDECDRLLHKGEDAVIYDLLRSPFTSAVVCITNDRDFMQKIDDRIRSSLQPAVLEFSRYSPIELKKILAERAAIAFKPGVCPPEAIALVAAYASKTGGDARVALEALWQCGKNAEARGSQEIGKSDFTMLKENPSQQKRFEGLSETEEKIMGFLKTRPAKTATSGELYGAIGLNDRTLRNYLRLLESKKLVSIETLSLPSGRTSRIRAIT